MLITPYIDFPAPTCDIFILFFVFRMTDSGRTRSPSNDLHRLIHSLGGPEKRYFRVQASRSGESEKKYLDLFDTIARQKVYDEEKIREEYAGEAFLRQLPATKNYLYRAILRSLREYRRGRTERVSEILENAEILAERGLFRQAAKEANRGLRRAETMGDHRGAGDAAMTLWSMLRDRPDNIEVFAEEGPLLLERARRHFTAYSTTIDLVELNAELLLFRSTAGSQGVDSSGPEAEFYRGMLDHPLLSDERSFDSTELDSLYHIVRGSLFQYLGEAEQALEEKRSVLELVTDQLHRDRSHLKNYLSVAQAYATALLWLERRQELAELIDVMHRLFAELSLTRQGEALFYSVMAMVETRRLLLCHAEGIPPLPLPSWIADTFTHGKYLGVAGRFHLRFVVATLHSLRCESAETIAWSSAGLKEKTGGAHGHLRVDLLLMRAIAHLDRGETGSLERDTRTLRGLQSKIDFRPHQRVGLQGLEEMPELATPRERSERAALLLQEIGASTAEKPVRRERNPIVAWLMRAVITRAGVHIRD